MQGVEIEVDGSVQKYVTEAERRKQLYEVCSSVVLWRCLIKG